ncbi:MFS transporter [Nonomuraea mangrovi]|uniref:MFS transporter n=1 Tax=Nonomuraea mangrovi TaxID=2316207 RepID=A0ABW4SU07_9ACTN
MPAPLPLGGLLALFTAAFTAVMTELLPAGLLPQISHDLHTTPTATGLLVTGYAITSCAAAIPVTAAVRTLPRRPVLLTVLAGFAAFNLLTALSTSYPLTFTARLLAGIMGGTLWAMLVGYATRMVPATHRGRAIAIVSAGITIALCAGIPAGTALAHTLGWRTTFAALAALALLLMAWVRLRVPDYPGENAAHRLPLRHVSRLPGIRRVLTLTLLVLLAHQATYTYIAPYAQHTGNRTDLALLVFGIATVAGIWITGTLIDRHPRATLQAAIALLTIAMLTLALLPAALLPATALWGTAFGALPTLLQAALVNASGPEHADTATSMQTTVYNLGIAAGSLTGGLVLQGAGPAALPWTTLLIVTATWRILPSRAPDPHRRPTTTPPDPHPKTLLK